MQVSTIAPSTVPNDAEGRASWQTQQALQLQDLEYDMFHNFVTTVSAWLDIFDPLQHFATLVSRLALYNEGLMKAIFAVGASRLAAKAPEGSCEVTMFKHAAVQYYSETLQYLQSAMRYSSYKNSAELLATTSIISTYEMLDGTSAGWERHLKGMFWIQRTREINGESGGLEQAVWWAWLQQDLWAALRGRRRCFSFFKPTKPYAEMNVWDVALRAVYLLAQCVNFSSDDEKRDGDRDPDARAKRADELAALLEEWNANKGVAFDPLPWTEASDHPFRPLWIHPPACAVAVQMYHVARILLDTHGTMPGTHNSRLDGETHQSIDIIAGLALRFIDAASLLTSTQCLIVAAYSCSDEARREGLLAIVEEKATQTGWFSGGDVRSELKAVWNRNAGV